MKAKGFLACVLAAIAFSAVAAYAAVKHEGSGTLTCQAATLTFTSFANAANNTVTIKVYKNGVVVNTVTHVFNGPSSTKVIPLGLAGSGTIEVKASWNTNGHSGSMTTNPGPYACETSTVTITTPGTTVTLPGTTTTLPAQTITLPAVTLPAVTTTLPAVTLPAVTTPGKTITKTVTKPRPPCLRGWHRAGNGGCYKVKKVVVIKKIHDRCVPPPDEPGCEGKCDWPKKYGGNG